MNEAAGAISGATSSLRRPWAGDDGLWAVVVAGGGGTRFGGPKQFASLHDRPVVEWAIEALGCVGRSVVVVPAGSVGSVAIDGAVAVAGGSTRSASVRSGLAALPSTADRVLIHDGARPLVSAEVVGRVVAELGNTAAAGADGVVPVVPVTDTLRTVDGHPVDRSGYVAVQTPQGFWVDAIRNALGRDGDATDDATLVTRAGGNVVHVDGDPANIKVTVPDDLAVAEAILARRGERSPAAQHREMS